MSTIENIKEIHNSNNFSISIETNKHNIAKNKYFVKDKISSSPEIKLGEINAAPNQAADRLINSPENDLNQGLEEKINIDSSLSGENLSVNGE